jgi:hypothetical protein
MAQHQLKARQDADEAKRQHIEQINALRQHINALRDLITETVPPAPASPRSPSRSFRMPHRPSLLPPLPPLDSPRHAPAPAPELPPPAPAPPHVERAVEPEPPPPPRRRSMCFTFSHFQINIRGRPGEILLAEVRTKSDTSKFLTTELLSREGVFRHGVEAPVPETRIITKIAPVYQAARVAEEEPPPRVAPPPEDERRDQRRSGPEIIQIGFSRMPGRVTDQVGYDFDVSTQLVEDKVAVVARKTVTLLVDNAKKDLIAQTIAVQKTIDAVVTKIEGKIDREFVERMFNKFRVLLADMNEKIANIQCSFLEWVTRDELELVLHKFLGVVKEVSDAAGTKVKYNCLLCGKPRAHLAGMSFVDMVPPEDEEAAPKGRAVKRYAPPDTGKTSRSAEGHLKPPHRDVVEFLTA